MRISLNWLKDYVSFDFSPDELANRLTMVGLEVEEIDLGQPGFSGIVVGRVVRLEDHPGAGKLKVCHVDIGESVLSIVCGAPNVAENQIVPVAKVGGVLGNGNTVKSKSIRGVASQGMICSERELGISDHHDGILVLDDKKYAVGENFNTDATDSDSVLHINVTPNRPDCLCHFGIARELGLIVGERFSKPDIKIKETEDAVEDWVQIEILDSEACPRYSARVVRDVTIGPSPAWMKQRLESVGIRSISNVVDITNYVLMETGHPLHAFDYDLIQGKKIVVRKAENGESFTTLDGEKRSLTSDDLLICDGERPVALAGVMGGLNSEVSEHAHHILLEGAYFDPPMIRKTAKRLGLFTEASQRFERGADPNNTVYAVDRAAQLLSEIANGKVMRGVADAYPRPIKTWDVSLRPSRISQILGTKIPEKRVESILEGLDLKVEGKDPIRVTVPTFRPDLTREIDLIEEIVRHHGYEKIPHKLQSNVAFDFLPDPEHTLIERLRDIFVGMGFLETMTNSMVSQDHISCIAPKIPYVSVQNPLNPETAFLRTSLIGGLLDAIQWNKNRSEKNVKFFEIGRVFWAKKKSLPDEKSSIAGVLSGSTRTKPFWGENDSEIDFFHLKGALETLGERLHIKELDFRPGRHDALKPETSMDICYDQGQIGFMGEIKSAILERWDISDVVLGFEMTLNDLFDKSSQIDKFVPIPKFPSIKRDLAIVVNEDVPVSSLKEVILKAGGENLDSVTIFDLYHGQQIPSGKKSIAFSLTFLSPNRTLKEEEVDPVVASIMMKLESSFFASLRS